jgi:DNA-binding transcriptional regulator YdaS (Cro superfamily)
MGNVRALKRAVQLAGGQSRLAARLRDITGRPIKQAHVWNWLNRGDVLPAEMVIPIEQAVDGGVSRHELRPDIYPAEAA